ncbi:MAG: hypothetical protein OK422_02750 [Thaumarchaeota archaeon]|nr:hypothetical protein [Nitrososphaerota archaeon]
MSKARDLTEQKRRSTAMRVMIVSPLVIAAFVIIGAESGFYLGGALGVSRLVLGMLFGAAGLLLAFPVLMKMINRMVANDPREPSSSSESG